MQEPFYSDSSNRNVLRVRPITHWIGQKALNESWIPGKYLSIHPKFAFMEIMNRYRVKAFGITKDLLGGREATIETKGDTVGHLRTALGEKYPQLSDLRSLYIAVNNDYADDQVVLTEADEIALIPPVSGG
jgi:molybdopterin synthase sulfur carrier subunit